MKVSTRKLCVILIVIIALSHPRHGLRACDTWVALPDATSSGCTLLGKNSDRTNFDCQPLFLHPRAQWPAESQIDLGRITIPQVKETFATLGSSPYCAGGMRKASMNTAWPSVTKGSALRYLQSFWQPRQEAPNRLRDPRAWT
jgi:hypothetical protein